MPATGQVIKAAVEVGMAAVSAVQKVSQIKHNETRF